MDTVLRHVIILSIGTYSSSDWKEDLLLIISSVKKIRDDLSGSLYIMYIIFPIHWNIFIQGHLALKDLCNKVKQIIKSLSLCKTSLRAQNRCRSKIEELCSLICIHRFFLFVLAIFRNRIICNNRFCNNRF